MTLPDSEMINLADLQILIGAQVVASKIEWFEHNHAMPAVLMRCYVVPGAGFGQFLDDGQPEEAGVELNLLLPPVGLADLIERLGQAALDLEVMGDGL